MGVVYQAEHRRMERLVALKVINHQLTQNATAIGRFHLEVKAAAQLVHPNIVTAYDADQAGDLHFLVMEYVDGISLARLVEKRDPLSVTQACHYIRQAALGLQHAHEMGMVHRDIKPQNLMVTRKEQVKILDFGLARLPRQVDKEPIEAHAPTLPGLTVAGCVLGTPDYLAPEQARNSHQADIRADIYSLGCTLYHLLAGHPPYPDGSALEKVCSHADRSPTPLTARRRDVPANLLSVLERMMAKDPAERFATPAEVAQALAPFAKAAPEPVAEAPARPTVPSGLRRFALAALAGLVGLVAVLGGWLTLSALRGPGAQVPARVLVVVTHEQFWEPDYKPLRETLDRQNARVSVASISGTSAAIGNQGMQIKTDLTVRDARADDYDAVVFVGSGKIGEFTNVGSPANAADARRLINEMLQAREKKYVGGLCSGMAVLADAEVLDNQPASWPTSQPVANRPEIMNCKARWDRTKRVVVSGRLLTGSSQDDSRAFAEQLLKLIHSSH
jgi:putative intracellular protease/amidase